MEVLILGVIHQCMVSASLTFFFMGPKELKKVHVPYCGKFSPCINYLLVASVIE